MKSQARSRTRSHTHTRFDRQPKIETAVVALFLSETHARTHTSAVCRPAPLGPECESSLDFLTGSVLQHCSADVNRKRSYNGQKTLHEWEVEYFPSGKTSFIEQPRSHNTTK